jgi:hypothetical protein
MSAPMDGNGIEVDIEEAPQGLDEREITAIIRDELNMSVGYLETESGQRREDLLLRYLGAPYGNEEEGYSQVVSRDVYETVEWALPQLIETFLAGDQVARFDPVGPEDEDEAMQQSDLANHVFLKENNGFLALATALKDGLTQEIATLHWYWERPQRVEHEFYEGLTPEQVSLIEQSGPEIEVTAASPSQFGEGLWDVEIRRRFDRGKLCIEAIPPEEVVYSADARSVDDARMVGRRRKVTASYMIDLGYDPELVGTLSGDGALFDQGLARDSRDSGFGEFSARNNRTDPEREIDLAEIWIRIDVDGDGIAELRHVVVATVGDEPTKLISHEPASRKPFAIASPILMPHRLGGISLAETVEDIAAEHTHILRAYMNALNLAQRPRQIVLGSPQTGPMADIDSLLSVVPGGYVTEYQSGAIRPFIETDVTAQSLAGLELMRGMREERTGITRTWQGMEAPNSLNDTARGMQMLSNAAGKRLALIARFFAELLVKPTFTGIAAELKQHQRVQKTIRLRGQWVNVDPTSWRNNYDATVEVGLGYGDQDAARFGIQQIAMLQEKLAAFPDTADMVSREKVWETTKEVCKSFGFKNASRFFNDPTGKEPPPPPGPSLEEQKLQQERELKEMELRIRDKEIEVKELDVRLSYEIEMLKLGFEANAPQPDPVGPAGSALDFGEMSRTVEKLHQSVGVASEIAALRDAMSRPRRVVRDESGAIVGSEVQ